MRTALGDSGSLIDRIVIDGGTVSGTTTLRVNNAGGFGALATGEGFASNDPASQSRRAA